MNSKDRVFAAVRGESVDRRPFTAMLSLYGARLTGCPLRQYYGDPDAYAQGQAMILETFHPDVLFSPFFCAAEGEAFGAKVKFFESQSPNLLHPAITSTAEISGLPVPDIDSHPTLVYIREALRQIARAHGQEVAVMAVMLTPVGLPLMIMGIDGWMQTVLFDQEGAKRMLDVTIPFFNEYANALLADGADVLVMPAPFLTPAVVTRQVAERFTLPVLRDAFAKVQGLIILHHAGGPFLKFLDLCTDLPNVIGFVVGYQDSLSEVRDKVGDAVTLVGGPDGPNIGRVSPEEVERWCKALLDDRRGDASFILGTSGPDVAFDAPPRNIDAIRRAVLAFDGENDG